MATSNPRKRPLITNIDRLPEKISLKNTRARQSLERVKRNEPESDIGRDGSSSSQYIDGKFE